MGPGEGCGCRLRKACSFRRSACAAYVKPAECAGAIAALDAGTPAETQCFGSADGGANGQLTAVALAFCGP